MSAPISVNLQDIKDKIVSSISSNPITDINSIVTYLPIVMSKIEVIKDLSGDQKRQLAIDIISQLIQLCPLNDTDKATLLATFNILAPTLITVVIDSANGIYNFGKEIEEKCAAKCC